MTRGETVLGTTPFAFVWGEAFVDQTLEIALDGYRTEEVRYGDVGGAARYELYLRPVEATPVPSRRRVKRPARTRAGHEAGWVETLSKPGATKPATPTRRAVKRKPPRASPPIKKAAPPAKKKRVYEEL